MMVAEYCYRPKPKTPVRLRPRPRSLAAASFCSSHHELVQLPARPVHLPRTLSNTTKLTAQGAGRVGSHQEELKGRRTAAEMLFT